VAKHPGYLLPENVAPTDFYCLRVYIPKEAEYLYAFSGAFQFFGKWLAWERDADNNAKLAAEVWRNAINYTFDNGWLNCGDDTVCANCDLIPLILEQLQELNNMNVNVNCGCGCGCAGGTPSIPAPPSLPPIPYPTPTPTPSPEDEDGLIWKCNLSHYLVYAYRYLMINAIQGGEYIPFNSLYQGLFASLTTAALDFAWAIYTLLLYLLNQQNPEVVTTPIDSAYDELVCAIMSAETDTQAYDNFTAVIASIFPTTILQEAALAMVSQIPFVVAFTPQELTSLPATHNNRTCDNCSTPPIGFPPINNGDLYTFTNPITIEETLEDEWTIVFDLLPGNQGYHYQAAWDGNGNQFDPRLQVTQLADSFPGDHIGYAYKVTSLLTTGGNDPADGKLRIGVNGIDPTEESQHVLQGETYYYVLDAHVSVLEEHIPGATLIAGINALDLNLTQEFHHYRRSGVTAPAGTLSTIIEVRYIRFVEGGG